VLNVNELAKGHAFMSVAAYNVSDDGNLLAYTTDDTGFRQYTLAVKDLRTGKQLADHAERVGAVVWANDNKTIFYTVEDATTKREYRLYRHTVGTTQPTIWFTKKRTSGSRCMPEKAAAKVTSLWSPPAPPPAKCNTSPPTNR